MPATPKKGGVIMALRHQNHILLVEDDEDALSATTAMLERLGYSVRAETEGLKALRTFSEEPGLFNLALLDHGMADVTGLETRPTHETHPTRSPGRRLHGIL